MRLPHNLEKSPFAPGEYTAWCGEGFAFRCRRDMASGYWTARPVHMQAAADRRYFSANTLTALAAKVGASTRERVQS